MSMMDEGCVALVPVETTIDPKITESYEIKSIRTAKIIEWSPDNIKVEIYNDIRGIKQEIWVPKRNAAIIENPLFTIMNEPNSTLQRLIRTVKSELRKKQAEERRRTIEEQLAGSKYGIAYADATERITQLNRSVDNNLMSQIEYLMSMLYSQLGITQTVMDGTADEATMLNYYNRTIEPIISSLVDEMKRKFLTKTARTQSQSILFFRDPFKLVPVSQIAEIADKFTRNEIMSSNEVRQVIGMKPSDDPKADELRNSNIRIPTNEFDQDIYEEDFQNGE